MSEMMKMNFIEMDHEVRVRLLEELVKDNKFRFDKLESKMDSQFHWMLGSMITLFVGVIGIILPICGAIILHMAKLI